MKLYELAYGDLFTVDGCEDEGVLKAGKLDGACRVCVLQVEPPELVYLYAGAPATKVETVATAS